MGRKVNHQQQSKVQVSIPTTPSSVVQPMMTLTNQGFSSQTQTQTQTQTSSQQPSNQTRPSQPQIKTLKMTAQHRENQTKGLQNISEESKQSPAGKQKGPLQEMTRVVKYLEMELHKARETSNSKIQDLEAKLMQAEAKNQKLKENIAKMEKEAEVLKKENTLELQENIHQIKIENDAKLKSHREKIFQLQKSLQTFESTRGQNEGKVLKDKLKASQNQVKTLLEKIEAKEAAWKTKEESIMKGFNEEMKTVQETISRLKLSLVAKDDDLADLKGKLMFTEKEALKDKLRINRMEFILKNSKKLQLKTMTKLNIADRENKRFKKENCLLKAVKVDINKMRIRIKSRDKALASLEGKLTEKNLQLKEIEALKTKSDKKYLDLRREYDELRASCEDHLEMINVATNNKFRYQYQIRFLEERCRSLSKHPLSSPTPSRSITRPKDSSVLQTGSMNIVEQFISLLDTDGAKMFKIIEDKCNVLEEQKKVAEKKLKEEIEKNIQLSIASVEMKAMEGKYNILEKQRKVLEGKLKEQVENNVHVRNEDEEMKGIQDKYKVLEKQQKNAEEKLEKNFQFRKTALATIEKLTNNNTELQQKLEEASQSDNNLFVMDSAPFLNSDKDVHINELKKEQIMENESKLKKEIEDLKALVLTSEKNKEKMDKTNQGQLDKENNYCKQLEMLKKELETKQGLMNEEIRLRQEVEEKIGRVEKEHIMKENIYRQELEMLRMQILRMSRQLELLKESEISSVSGEKCPAENNNKDFIPERKEDAGKCAVQVESIMNEKESIEVSLINKVNFENKEVSLNNEVKEDLCLEKTEKEFLKSELNKVDSNSRKEERSCDSKLITDDDFSLCKRKSVSDNVQQENKKPRVGDCDVQKNAENNSNMSEESLIESEQKKEELDNTVPFEAPQTLEALFATLEEIVC